MQFHRTKGKYSHRHLEDLHPGIKANKQWFLDIIKEGRHTMWGKLGALLTSPDGENKIYTDKCVEKYLKDKYYFSQKFLDEHFYFIKNFTNDEEIFNAKQFYKGYRLTKNDIGFWNNIDTIHECFELIQEEQIMMKKNNIGCNEMIIAAAQNARRKAKELEFCLESVDYQLQSNFILLPHFFQLKDYYRLLKYLIKSINLNMLLKFKIKELQYIYHKSEAQQIMVKYQQHQSHIIKMVKSIKIFLYQKFSIEYIFNKNKMIYEDKYFAFNCKGYSILKCKKGQTLKNKLKEKSKKRCGHCSLLEIRSKKNKKFKRHKCSKCQRIYYCNKSCQKRHWSSHKLMCY